MKTDWKFLPAHDAFDNFRERWDSVNKACGNHVLLDSIFVGALLRHFAPRAAFLGFSEAPSQRGLALLVKEKAGFWGIFTPSQGPLGLLLLESREGVEEQMARLLRGLPGHALALGVTLQDPDFSPFETICDVTRFERVEHMQTARVSVYGTFEEYWNLRGKDLVENIARRRRRLERDSIRLQFAIERDPEKVSEAIREYGGLELSGWKGAKGTAVSDENAQGKFYQEILERFCARGEGVIYRLLFDGKAVASQLGLEREGMLVLLKMAYDESFRSLSPGYLLQEQILRSVFTRGTVKKVEFYGKVREGWTLKWTNELRPMYHVNCYRYGWVATVRSVLKAHT